MSEELKLCPSCGKLPLTRKPKKGVTLVWCSTHWCLLCAIEFYIETWQSRPPTDMERLVAVAEVLPNITLESRPGLGWVCCNVITGDFFWRHASGQVEEPAGFTAPAEAINAAWEAVADKRKDGG